MASSDVWNLCSDVVEKIQFKERVRYCIALKKIKALLYSGQFRKALELLISLKNS